MPDSVTVSMCVCLHVSLFVRVHSCAFVCFVVVLHITVAHIRRAAYGWHRRRSYKGNREFEQHRFSYLFHDLLLRFYLQHCV